MMRKTLVDYCWTNNDLDSNEGWNIECIYGYNWL